MAASAGHQATVRHRRRPGVGGGVPDSRAGLLALGRAAAPSASPASRRCWSCATPASRVKCSEAALCAGIAAAGGQALLGGVLPTPAASILVRRYGFDMGAVISASHNPYQDNGIKFFGCEGKKLSDEAEAAVEAHVHAGGARARGGRTTYGRVRAADRSDGRLSARARQPLRVSLEGTAGAARLCERRDVQGGADAVRAARRGGRMHRVRAGRREHQRAVAARRTWT